MKNLLLPFLVLCSMSALAQTSRLGSYTAVVIPTGGAQHAGEVNSVRVVVKDRAGTQIFEVSKEIPYDVPFPAASVFESGTLMLIYGFDGFIEFYSRTGILLNTLRPLKDARPEHERIIASAIHDSIAALLISEPGWTACQLLVISDRGDVLSDTQAGGTSASGIAISNAGSLVAAGTTRWEGPTVQEETYFVSSAGVARGSVQSGFTRGEFSDNDAFFLGWTNRHATTVSIAQMKIVTTLAMQQGEMVVGGTWNGRDAVVLSAANPVLQQGLWVYRHPVLQSMTTTGLVKLLQEIPSAEFTSATLERSGDQVLLKLETALGPGRKQ